MKQKYPLVIFLHGSGENGTDNEAQLKWGVMNFASEENMKMHPAFVIAPQCPPDMEWANATYAEDGKVMNIDKPSKTGAIVIELIKDLIIRFPVDTDRIYITGLSSGGHGTFDLIMRYPNTFAAAVPVCGSSDISKAADIAHIPMWIFHGAEDPSVNPEYSRKMVDALAKVGAYPGYTQYPAKGHFCWLAAYSDPLMMNWLFSQHK